MWDYRFTAELPLPKGFFGIHWEQNGTTMG